MTEISIGDGVLAMVRVDLPPESTDFYKLAGVEFLYHSVVLNIISVEDSSISATGDLGAALGEAVLEARATNSEDSIILSDLKMHTSDGRELSVAGAYYLGAPWDASKGEPEHGLLPGMRCRIEGAFSRVSGLVEQVFAEVAVVAFGSERYTVFCYDIEDFLVSCKDDDGDNDNLRYFSDVLPLGEVAEKALAAVESSRPHEVFSAFCRDYGNLFGHGQVVALADRYVLDPIDAERVFDWEPPEGLTIRKGTFNGIASEIKHLLSSLDGVQANLAGLREKLEQQLSVMESSELYDADLVESNLALFGPYSESDDSAEDADLDD